MSFLQHFVERQWYGRLSWLILLAPLSGLFFLLSTLRRARQCRTQESLPLPVIVVGNITVGGTGKTPVVVALVNALRQHGFNPGVISRGYGAGATASRLLPKEARAEEYGDEPVLIAASAACPVAVGASRVDSVRLLAQHTDCNVVISDDGLQHYRLARQVEIAVVDAARGSGNGWLLPVGPLRELPSRLQAVDSVLINGSATHLKPFCAAQTSGFELAPVAWKNVLTGETRPLHALDLRSSHAIAGIGHPQRFFDLLKRYNFNGEVTAFADHHRYTEQDLIVFKEKTLLMTEKDAVKCRAFAGAHWWALQVSANLPRAIIDDVLTKLRRTSV